MPADLSPIEMGCPRCEAHGRVPPDWALCPTCDGTGKTWKPGAPGFQCKTTLADCSPGDLVTLGSGHVGRILRHQKRGRPTTELYLLDPLFEEFEERATSFPSCAGVTSYELAARIREDRGGNHASKYDNADPLQRRSM